MSRGQKPLVLMMALSLPGAAHALGLGEIHVNSALNEPLAADIEILGATAEELSSLRASVASKDTFVRFGAERPAFLSSATFKVSQDAKGRPVLVVRSTESFTDPLVNLLVDLRWHNGEVIRQYSLLLDPAGFPAAAQVAAAARSLVVPPAAPLVSIAAPSTVPVTTAAETRDVAVVATAVPAASTAAATPAASTRTMTHVKIGAKATLRGIAWRVGARSDSDLKKTMLAIFRANPHAFEGNINRLHLGAVLTIPSAADISAISKGDAGREIQAQMTAWRSSTQNGRTAAAPRQAKSAAIQEVAASTAPVAPIVPAAPVTPVAQVSAVSPVTAASDAPVAASDATALTLRVQSLETGLRDMQAQLKREHDKLLNVQAQVRYAENAAEPVVDAPPVRQHWLPSSLIAAGGLLAGALGMMFLKRRRAKPNKKPASTGIVSAPIVDEASVSRRVIAEPLPREVPRSMPRPVWQDANELSVAEISAPDEETVLAPAVTQTPKAPKPVFTVNEDELRAAYEDTLDLSSETAILAADIAAASDETESLPAATVNLDAQELQAAAAAATGVADAVDESATAKISTEALRVETKLDYDLQDLDQTAQHVQMPSVLHERAIVKERRTNLVDVLKMAVEREPDRRDLRMKLLETYYAAAAANRRGFLELVQKVARDRTRLDDGEWEKIAFMGKEIAADSALFSADSEADDELADCA